MGDCLGPPKESVTRRNVTRGGGGGSSRGRNHTTTRVLLLTWCSGGWTGVLVRLMLLFTRLVCVGGGDYDTQATSVVVGGVVEDDGIRGRCVLWGVCVWEDLPRDVLFVGAEGMMWGTWIPGRGD